MAHFRILLCSLALAAGMITAGSEVSAWQASSVKTIEISPAIAEGEVGQQLKFTAIGKDESGKPLDLPPAAWFAAPFDVAAVSTLPTLLLLLLNIWKQSSCAIGRGNGRRSPLGRLHRDFIRNRSSE